MKTYILLIICLLFSIQFVKSQNSTFQIDWSRVDFTQEKWTVQQVFDMTAKFQIQDTFFVSATELKKKYEILKYLPQPDFDKYCNNLKKTIIAKNEFNTYFIEIKNISTIDEWLSLISKYPSVGKDFMEEPEFYDEISFTELVKKLKNREKLIFVKENGAILITENTRYDYKKFKHLKRLK